MHTTLLKITGPKGCFAVMSYKEPSLVPQITNRFEEHSEKNKIKNPWMSKVLRLTINAYKEHLFLRV